jgi:hypothetical protein
MKLVDGRAKHDHDGEKRFSVGGRMDRDIALRTDGMLMAIRANLDSVAHYAKNDCTEQEFKKMVRLIGSSMGETIEISNSLHKEHPDIVPRELRSTSRRKKPTK